MEKGLLPSQSRMFHVEVVKQIKMKYTRVDLRVMKNMEFAEVPTGKMAVFCRRVDLNTKAVFITAVYTRDAFDAQKIMLSQAYIIDSDFPLFGGPKMVSSTKRPRRKKSNWADRAPLLCSII